MGRYPEAKCWTCERGRSFPDPLGCIRIRTSGEESPNGTIITNLTKNSGKIVIECPQYISSKPRKPEVAETKRKAEIEKKKVEVKENSVTTAKKEKKERFCRNCGEKLPLKARGGTIYCGERCKKEMAATRVLAGDYQFKEGEERERICTVCGRVFIFSANNQKCCSSFCSDEAKKITQRNFYRAQKEHLKARGAGV